jgi:hypothetical protein
MSVIEDLYRETASANVEGGERKIEEDGDFLVETHEIRVSTSVNVRTRGALLWVVTFEIVEGGSAAHPNGSKRAWVAKPTLYPQAKSAMKAHICASLGVDAVGDKGALTEVSVRAVHEDQILHGTLVRLATERITTKSSLPFTVHRWYPAKEGEIVRRSAKPATAGWEIHPDSPGHAWCPATGEVVLRGEVGL